MSQPRYGTPTRAASPISPATIALVVALLVPPAGIVLGVLARRDVRRTGGPGGGTAQAAVVVGVALTVVWTLLAIYVVVLVANADTLLPGPPIPD